jgi:hypothetical protein
MSVSYGGSSITFEDGSIVSSGSAGFKNKIINGAMTINQRWGTTANTPVAGVTYTVDRWHLNLSQSSKVSFQQNAGSVSPPVGFKDYIGLTSTSAYSVVSGDYATLRQSIEGYNIVDLDWGTANAKSITLSFWVRSSLTGTFGGTINNGGYLRSYPYTYTINSANTWEYKTVVIPGDTTGTWESTTSSGIHIGLGFGTGSAQVQPAGSWYNGTALGATGQTNVLGTNGATFYVTGVQVEKSSTASSFEFRSYGTELALCQRYYEKSYDITTTPGSTPSNNEGVWLFRGSGVDSRDYVSFQYKQSKRASPTVTIYSVTGASGFFRSAEGSTNHVAQVNGGGVNSSTMQSNSTAPTNNQCGFLWTASAEL